MADQPAVSNPRRALTTSDDTIRPSGEPVTKYRRGDYIKVEFADGCSGQMEWMWLEVDFADDEKQLVFGRLDNEPIINTELRLGRELAVSFRNILDHRRFPDLSMVRRRDGSFDA